MLTQSDLRAIGKIIDEKISPLETKMESFETKMGSFETKMGSFEKKLSSLGKKTDRGFKSVDRKLDVIINYFDYQDIDIRKRLDRLEIHLGLVPLNS